MATTATWSGQQFSVYEAANTNWNDKAGIYIFASITPQNQWKALYIGQADSFKSRLANHERWAEAQRLGAAHVHAIVVPLQANRDSLERQLIQAFQPPLNTLLK